MKHQDIIFLQGKDANEALGILGNNSEQEAIEYLKQWDHSEGEIVDNNPAESFDTVYEGSSNYILTYNVGLNYIGLGRKIE